MSVFPGSEHTDKGVFSKALEGSMWDSTRAAFGRVYIAACSNETNSLTARLSEVKKELQKFPYKIGILVVTVADASEYAIFQPISLTDGTEQLLIRNCAPKTVKQVIPENMKQKQLQLSQHGRGRQRIRRFTPATKISSLPEFTEKAT